MKNKTNLLLVAIWLIAGAMACMKVSGDQDFPSTITGRWVLTDTQSPGIGPPGVWAVASPSGRWMEIDRAGNVSGTVFPAATGYQLVDSNTLKVMDPTQQAGFRLFSYKLDTVEKAMFFYKRPPNGGFCIEGCGAYKFKR